MEELIKNASEADLLGFSKTFLGTYGAHGFQSLAKRDADLLLFYALEHSGVVDSREGNHQVARRLRLTPDPCLEPASRCLGAVGRAERRARAPGPHLP